MRYTEEVELLLEEMRRVKAFLEWDRDRWKRRALHVPDRASSNSTHPMSATPGVQVEFEEGLKAYALRQASVHERLFRAVSQQRHDVPAFIEIADRGLADGGEEVDSVM